MNDPLLGIVIGDRFKVVKEIGAGQMGSVYEARSATGRRIAVKFLHRHLTRDEESVERFRRESAAASQVSSPFVARVLASGSVLADDASGVGGYPYIAFELLEGDTLAQRLRAVGAIPIDAVTALIDNILVGLSAAHEIVVHRDIKPANIILTSNGESERAVILDFGISKVRGQVGLTKVASTLGSVAYMAPEQLEDAACVDERADLYAVGVVAFEALTGVLPFSGRTTLEVEQFKKLRRAQSLATRMGDRWQARLAPIEAVLAKLMARPPENRYVNANEALAAWRSAGMSVG